LIHEEIYIKQLPGYKKGGDDQDLVCKLNKALYRLKQSPKLWFDTLAAFLAELGTFIAAFVDDLQLIGPSLDTINEIKATLYAKFQIIDLGASSFYLGIEVTRDRACCILKLS
jgi:hypothetical protein